MPAQSVPLRESFGDQALPFLKEHCFRCHGGQKQEGSLRLDTLSLDASPRAADQWLEVLDRVNNGEMPPETEEDQPTAEQRTQFVKWISAWIWEGESVRLRRRDRVSFNQLTRDEYANTIYDLLGVNFDVADPGGLRAEANRRGFDRIGAMQSLTAPQLERYLAAAEAILTEAYPATSSPAVAVQYRALDLIPKRDVDNNAYDQLQESGLADHVRIDLWPGQEIGIRPIDLWDAGQYRFRIQVSGLKPAGGRAPHLVCSDPTLDRLLFEQDVIAPEERPVVVEFEVHLPAGAHQFTLRNELPGPNILTRFSRSIRRPFFSLEKGYVPWQWPLQDENGSAAYPCLIVDWIQWRGPVIDDGAQQRRLGYVSGNLMDAHQICAGLESFAERAFRRPLKDAEVDKYVHLVESEIEAGQQPLPAIRTAMQAILCAKDFLYLVEGDPERDVLQIDDWELASRLSYFLWSTMPDEELFRLARKGTLHQQDVLRGQLKRMLRDPRSARFAEAFARQWLQLDQVGLFPPDSELYPDYDAFLERSMIRESTEFFREVLWRNFSLREFLVSEWTMLNSRLALHYGIDGVDEGPFRLVSLTADQHRGGVLTHASVLSLTSDGARHRPVHRGKWISESILGITPPPPPNNVDSIEPTPIDAPKSTIREKLAAHTRNPTCASCHNKIDPLGFAFDSYNAIGHWRTVESDPTGMGLDRPVDASGVLPDGRPFANTYEFQQRLLEDIDQFNAAFVTKLATFALRRVMTADDREDLLTIAAESKNRGYQLQDIIEALVLSELFRRR